VFNDGMKRLFLVIAASMLGVVALVPTAASATIVELGETPTPLTPPACPKGVSGQNCTIILTETTALETLSDGVYYPTTATRAGKIVAFTVGLAKLSKGEIQGLNSSFGGASQVAIAVLRPGTSAKPGQNRLYSVVAESPLYQVQPWFGHVVQFPLDTSLPIRAGDVVALTVPTWAPVLAINLDPKKFAYRTSRGTKCTTINVQSAQLTVGQKAQYRCFFTATRVEYTATEVTTPVVPKDAVKSRDRTSSKASKASKKPRHLAPRIIR
jgi:hypothetical protein